MEKKESFVGKKNEVTSLIRKSKMSLAEKEAWLNLIEEMLEHEIEEFIQILKDEENALRKIEEKYQEKIHKIKTDFNKEWEKFVQKAETEIDKTEKTQLKKNEEEELGKLREQLK